MRQGPALQARSFSFDTPPPPPTKREDDLTVLRLIRSRRVGPTTFHRLLAEHGSAAAALDALPRIASESGITGYTTCPVGVAQAELAAGARAGARLIRFDDPAYPTLLATLSDAPPVLWMRGRIEVLERTSVAVIGARNASSLGLRMARGLARGLAEAGLTVVAGLARGIDTAAHDASCEAGTVAVMAGGIDVIYPPENRDLAQRLCETGCLLSEQPPGVEPVARHFPARNRIVSGLSAGVVVIEAAHRSGSLITARCGADQGREIMVVPGHPLDARAAGCNALIRDGATLVRSTADVIAALEDAGAFQRDMIPACEGPKRSKRIPTSEAQVEDGPPAARRRRDAGDISGVDRSTASSATVGSIANNQPPMPVPASGCTGAHDLRGRLLALLGPSPSDEDSVIRDLGVSPASLAPALLDLELEGLIIRLPGGRMALAG